MPVTGEPVARPNGVLNVGEAARISVSISYTPIGTLISQPPAPGPGWRVNSFVETGVEIFTPPGAWSQIGSAPGWWQFSSGSQLRMGIFVGQSPILDFRNPLPDIWHGIWKPSQHTNSNALFTAFQWGNNTMMSAELEGEPPQFAGFLTTISQTSISIPISSSPAPCYANCDGSTAEPILTVDDFICFVNEFALAHALPPAQQVTHYANCDGSTTQPVLTVNDFVCFINEFAQGCP
jgi:hypothetical protein